MEQLEKDFIDSMKSSLAKTSQICEEILSMIGEKEEMKMEKAKVFCDFFRDYKCGVNLVKLRNKCDRFLNYYNSYHSFKKVSNERRNLEFDITNMRLNSL